MYIPHSLAALSLSALASARSSLYVDNAPTYVRPYVIEHYAPAQGVSIGQQVYRFPVTGPSSGGAFSMLSTSAPGTGDLGVLPHHHQTHHENFFALKGRFQLWAQPSDSNVTQQARLLTQGDYGSVPRNTTHTFQVLDPDTEMLGVISPGGFEDLFFFLASSNYSAATHTPYVPAASNSSSGAGSSSSIISALETYDVYAELDFAPRRDFVNGSAPSGSGWHELDSNSTIPSVAGSPYFVAKDYGPKYLNSDSGYSLVQPFVTPVTGEGTFTQGSITLSRLPANAQAPKYALPNHTALQVLEGGLTFTIGAETVTLFFGDVAFIPGNTTFSYQSATAFTKLLYVSAGTQGLDQQLLKTAESWDYPVFPTTFAQQ